MKQRSEGKKNTVSPIGSPSSGNGSRISQSNPLLQVPKEASQAPFDFARQSNPELTQEVDNQRLNQNIAQQSRLREIGQTYDQAQGGGTTEAIRQAADRAAEKPLQAGESASNSLSNFANRLQGTIPRLQIVSTDLVESALGKELAKSWYEFEGRDIDQVRNEAYAELEQLASEVKPTLTLTGAIEKGSLKDAAAGMVNAITSIGSSAVPAIATGGAGLFTEMTGDALVDFNQEKAKRLGVTIDELYASDQNDFKIPATIGALSGGLELVGLKGVGNLITKKLTGSGFKKAALIFAEANKEGLTEFLQTGLEEANRSLGKGDSATEASKKAVDKMFSKDGLESYLQGVVGSAGAGGLGRVVIMVSSPEAKTTVAQDIQNIGLIEMELAKPEVSDQAKAVLANTMQQSVSNIADVVNKDIEATSKLGIEQQREADGLNAQIDQLDAVINDPAISEEVKATIEPQREALETQLVDVLTAVPKTIEEVVPPINETRVGDEEYNKIAAGALQKGIKKNEYQPVYNFEQYFDDKEIYDIVKNSGLKVVVLTPEMAEANPLLKGSAGKFLYGNTIMIDPEYLGKTLKGANILQHEAAHAFTVSVLQEQDSNLSPTELEFKNEVRKAFSDNKKTLFKPYGLTNELEFVAEFYGNPEFRNYLKNENISLWRKIVKLISGVLNIDNSKLDKIFGDFKQTLLPSTKTTIVNEAEQVIPAQEAVVEETVSTPEAVTTEAIQETVEASEPVLKKAEDDLTALKQVKDKVKKYQGSIKRLNDALRAGTISEQQFNDTKARFDDVIADSAPNIPKVTNLTTEEVTQLDNELKNENITTNDFIEYERARAIEDVVNATEAVQEPGVDNGASPTEVGASETAQTVEGEKVAIQDSEVTLQDKVKAIQDKRQSIKDRISEKIKAQRGNLSSGFDPSLMSDFVDLGATYIEEGIVNAKDFIKRFREDYRDLGFDDSTITDTDIENEILRPNQQSETSPKQDVKEPTPEEGRRERTNKVLDSKDFSDDFKEALSDHAIYYSRLPNEITDAEAQAIIDIKGVTEAEVSAFDFNNSMSLPVRFKIMNKLIDYYQDNGDLLKAVDLYERFVERTTDTAQGLQALSSIKPLGKAAQVASAKRNVEGQRKKFKEKTKKVTGEISKQFKKANKEAAEETVKNVKKIIEQATKIKEGETITDLPIGYGTKNKVFTRDKYLKSKQKLRGMVMSSIGGLPVEDVINIAGYHIEATGRDFARFSRRMKADLGGKIKPYLKDIYGKTRESLVEEGYDPKLFLTDQEVDAQINEAEGQAFKEKLDKAIQKKDAKEQRVAIKKLQEISKDEGLWGQYKDSAASRLKSMVLTNAEKDISTDPSLQQFTDGLVKNMKAKMAELLPEQAKRNAVPRPDIEIIGDAYKNFEKYQEVWDKTQKEFQDKYADQPEVLQSIDEYFGEILDKPFSDKGIERAVNKGLKDMETNISDLVIQHYTILDNAKQSLRDKLVNEAGLTGAEAQNLANAIEAEFDRIATRKKQQILAKVFSNKTRKKPEARTLEGDIIKMTNLGAFRTDDVVEIYGDKMGWPKLTAENIKEIERLSDAVQNTKDPIKKRRAIEDLLGYQAKIKGMSITDLVTSVWYANMLSGYNTQFVNFGANAINTALLYGNAIAQRPKDALFIGRGLVNGIYRGILEAEETFRTGYSPIKGKIEVPQLLELTKFKGGKINPANYLKYVRRIMIAADVVFFEGQKEMRAYQLASKESSKEGLLEPTLNQRQRALEIVGRTNGQIQAIQEALDIEYNQEAIDINAMEISSQEKATMLKQAERDRDRKVFDLVEQQRSSDMLLETSEYAAEGTYNYQPKGGLGAIALGINRMVEDLPVLRYAIPFTNIIANVANETINYTPLAFTRLKKGGFTNFRREELTPQQRIDLTTKAAIGTTLSVIIFGLTQIRGEDDEPFLEITSKGTGDFAKNETLKEQGWKEYSLRFKLPNGEYTGWWSYQYTPLIATLGYIGHINDLQKYKKDMDKESVLALMSKAAGLTTTSFFENTYLDGLGNLLSSILDPRSSEKLVDKAMKGAVGAVKGVAIPNLYSQTAQALEQVFGVPKKEVRETILGSMLQDIPYARNAYYDKINILGDEIMPSTDKFYFPNKPNKIIKLLVDKKAVFAPINRKAEKIYDMELGKERVLNDEEFYKYSKYKGQFIKEALEDGYENFDKMGEETFKKALTSIKKSATKMARYKLAGVDPSVTEITETKDGDSKVYELNSKQIKRRLELNRIFIANNIWKKPNMVSKFIREGLSRKEAEAKAELKLQGMANSDSKDKLLRENSTGGNVTLKEKE